MGAWTKLICGGVMGVLLLGFSFSENIQAASQCSFSSLNKRNVASLANYLHVDRNKEKGKYATLAGIEEEYRGTAKQNETIKSYLIAHCEDILNKKELNSDTKKEVNTEVKTEIKRKGIQNKNNLSISSVLSCLKIRTKGENCFLSSTEKAPLVSDNKVKTSDTTASKNEHTSAETSTKKSCSSKCEKGYHKFKGCECIPNVKEVPCRNRSIRNGFSVQEQFEVQWNEKTSKRTQAPYCEKWDCNQHYHKSSQQYVCELDEHLVQFFNESTLLSSQTVKRGKKLKYYVPKDISGYRFVGWFQKDFPRQRSFYSDVVQGDLDLYARYEPVGYTIKYLLNGGRFDETPKTTYTIEEDFDLQIPVRLGYSFVGWKDRKSKDTSIYETVAVYNRTGNLMYEAFREENKYQVSFVIDGDVVYQDDNTIYGQHLAAPKLTETGYVVKGWFTDEKLTTPYDFYSTYVTDNLTLYGKRENLSYTVSFDSNGGDCPAMKQIVTYGNHLQEPNCIPKMKNNTFLGWYEVDEKGNYRGNESFDFNQSITESKNIKAKRSKELYTVSFYDGDILLKKIEGVAPGTILSSQDLNNEDLLNGDIGYHFSGWFDKKSGKKFTEKMKIDSNLTLVAKREINHFKIVYNANGGKGSISSINNIAYGSTIRLSNGSNLSRNGYQLIGWNTEANGDGTSYLLGGEIPGTLTTDDNAVITLYANWELKY